jgi:hypothetical protein
MGALWQILPGQTSDRQCSFASLQHSTLPRGVQHLRLTGRLSKLLDANRETAHDVAAGKRGLHGRGREAAFKIAEQAAGLDTCDNLQLAELQITHHQD